MEQEELEIISGIKELVHLLKQRSLQLAIATGSSRKFVVNFLKRNQLEQHFDTIITGEQFTRSKPYSEYYLLAFKRLRIRPEEAIIIEDSLAGVVAGKSAGATVHAVMGTPEANLSEADRQFTSVDGLLQFIGRSFTPIP